MNGKLTIGAITFIVSLLTAYFTSEINTAEKVADRPTRQEVKEAIQETQKTTQRELDDIKKRQDQTYNEVQKLNENFQRYMMRQQKNGR